MARCNLPKEHKGDKELNQKVQELSHPMPPALKAKDKPWDQVKVMDKLNHRWDQFHQYMPGDILSNKIKIKNYHEVEFAIRKSITCTICY